ALALERWFEMEAKNCDSVENLWSEFQFMLLKLNFARAHLIVVDGRREWKRTDDLDPAVPLLWNRYEFSLGAAFSVEFATECDALDPDLFNHLSEIVAEAWHRAVAAWCALHHLPLRLNSRAYLNSPRKASLMGR